MVNHLRGEFKVVSNKNYHSNQHTDIYGIERQLSVTGGGLEGIIPNVIGVF
jgi:hypothetical protein